MTRRPAHSAVPEHLPPSPDKSRSRAIRMAAILAVVGVGIAGSGWAVALSNRTDAIGAGSAASEPARKSEEVSLRGGESFDLTAGFVTNSIDGVEQPMMAYNGSVPGPTMRVQQGETVTVNFANNIDMATTVHAHGLRQEVAMDGMPGISQEPIEPGDTFTYTWSFPDPGMYWFHPHVREDYQQATGLYGTIIVEPSDSQYWPPVDAEQTLVLNDVLVDQETGLLTPFPKDQADHTLMGRYGNVPFVNGDPSWRGSVKQGAVTRFSIVNASNARPYRFSMGGLPMKIVGSDNGRVGTERMVDAVTMSPGERIIVDVLPQREGEIALRNDAEVGAMTLGAIAVEASEPTFAAASFRELRTNSEVIADISALEAKASDEKELILTMGSPRSVSASNVQDRVDPADGVDQETGGIEWQDDQMNAMGRMQHGWSVVDLDANTANTGIDWSFNRGQVVRVVVTNPDQAMHPMQHPIHFHGQRFAVSKIDGVANSQLEWKDVATIPRGSSYELLVEMDQPGTWMVHCHIAEHAEAGMLMHLNVS